MAGKIKGITVEIGGNTQPLENALKGVNSSARNLNSELRTINQLLKLDPSNTALLTQKQQVLAQSIEQTKQKLELLKTAQQQAQQQLAAGNIGEEQYRELERQVIATEQSLDRLEQEARETDALEAAGNESVDAARDIDRVGDASRQSADETGRFSERSAVSFAAVTMAIQTVINTVTQMVSKLKDAALSSAVWADTYNTMSAQFHVSTESLQKFAYAADIVDVSVETFGSSLGKLTKNIGKAAEGTAAQKEAFETLGVSITDTNGNMRSAEDVFYDVIDALGEMDNETQADIVANDLFGRSFQDLNPLVAAGSGKLRELGDEAVAVGAVMSQDALDGANALQDSLDKLSAMTGVAQRAFSQGMAPALTRVTDLINEKLASPATQQALMELGELIGSIVEAFMNFALSVADHGDVILRVLLAIGAGFAAWKITTIIQSVITSVQTFATKFTDAGMNVITMIKQMDKASLSTVIGAIAALVVAVIGLTEHFLGASAATEDFKDDMSALKDEAEGMATDFNATREALSLNAGTMRDLSGEIQTLDAKIKSGKLSSQELASAQAELAGKVVQYNTAAGEEVLKIDSVTGAIEGSTDALAQNTEEIIRNAEQAAIMNSLTEAYEGQVKAQSQNAAMLNEINSHYDELSDAQKEAIDRMNEEGNSLEALSDLWWASPITGGQVNNDIRGMVEGMEDSIAAEEAFAAQIEELNPMLEEQQTVM